MDCRWHSIQYMVMVYNLHAIASVVCSPESMVRVCTLWSIVHRLSLRVYGHSLYSIMTYLDYRLQMVTMPDYNHLLQPIDHHRLQTIDYRSQTVTVDCRLQLIDCRLQPQTMTIDYQPSPIDYRPQALVMDYRVQALRTIVCYWDHRLQTIDGDHTRLQPFIIAYRLQCRGKFIDHRQGPQTIDRLQTVDCTLWTRGYGLQTVDYRDYHHRLQTVE